MVFDPDMERNLSHKMESLLLMWCESHDLIQRAMSDQLRFTGRDRPSGDIDSRPRRRLRAAGSDLIAAIRRSVARRCASSPTEAPTVRQILVHLGERLSPARFSPARGPPLWRCRMPGRAGSTPKPSRHRITNSISVSRGRCHDKTRPRSPVMGRLVPGAIRPTVCACSRDPKHSSEGDSCHF